ncbi:DUF1735 domain-containing protein [Sphingobacterium siyangense]|uniref:DUF1735 domain-containing protein n=1 Tax=Sphingobacterium siyangense TaxID=459529 RepID=UPI0019662A76|nr:DUF1735 domain-containing protein [Sphingobacterium siyangense]QRY57435.1 DUF1735 domain-containing protein [Sphingobacterium siyangense]
MKKIINYISVLLLPFMFTSCLKDDAIIGPDAAGNVENIIEFKNFVAPSSGTSSKYPLYIQAFDMVPTTDFAIPVQIAGVYNPKADVKVTLELDNSIITAYNAQNGSKYQPLQTANYTVSTYEVTIPKGQKIGNLNIKFFPEKFDFKESYALGLKIKSVSEGTISGNFGAIVLGVVPKNLYDGVYTVEKGLVQRYTGGALNIGDALNGSLAGNPKVTLKSIDGNTVEITNMRWAGGTSGIAGIDNLRATINPATNEVTMFALGAPTLRNIAGKVNKYDPATKTFTLNFDWAQTTNKREILDLQIKFDSPRP